MSSESDLERRLREARRALPEPDAATTERARLRALGALRRRRRRVGFGVLIGAALVVALVLGASIGSVTAPSVTAAQGPNGFGFLPEHGWFALQSGGPIGPGQPEVAIASNVAFARDDDVYGLAETSGLPYSTLLGLPPEGIVIVASIVTPASRPPVPFGDPYPERELPLRFRDAVPFIQYGTQIRPEEPLGQYQLRALIRGYNVDLTFYFGAPRPSSAQRAAVQRQLQRLLVGSKPVAGDTGSSGNAAESSSITVIDRTYSCTTVLIGGLYQVRAKAHPGERVGSSWSKVAYASIASGSSAGPLTGLETAPANSLAWITAGRPTESTTANDEWQTFPVQAGGTLGVNRSLCKLSTASVRLAPSGLRGGAVVGASKAVDCDAPRRVLVRFRATVRAKAALGERARIFLATSEAVRDAKLAVRSPGGKLLAYADVAESGKASLFAAPRCQPE